MSTASGARDEILGRVRCGLGRKATEPAPVPPPLPRAARRPAGEPEVELNRLLAEIEELGGCTRRLYAAELPAALADLVQKEQVQAAIVWSTPEIQELGLAAMLANLGVALAPAGAAPRQVAACDLGITGVDAALPDTGTLLLRSGPGRPRTASVLPRVHLAILTRAVLVADLAAALAATGGGSSLTLITGPSRTSDIELTLTIGVHGPRALHVWVLEG